MAIKSSARSTEPEGLSFVLLLADICRRFPDLRDWLIEDFARNAGTRANFLSLVKNGQSAEQEEAADGFAGIAGEARSWLEEKRQLRTHFFPNASKLFGGRTWHEMEGFVRRYEARTVGLETFLMARDWSKAGEAGKNSPRLLRRGADFLDAVIRSGDKRRLDQLSSAVEILSGLKRGRLSAAFGHVDWWKLHALLFMLRHPREAYRTREVRAHLAKLGLDISSLDFRRFCRRHGIRRDERAGRPRKLL
jgi:hypothetical protein